MAKKLAEIQKEFDKLYKQADTIIEKLVKINTNFWEHNGMLFQGLDMLDERIAELKKKGAKGDAVSDFMNDKDVKAFVKGIDDCKGFCRKESDAYYSEVDTLKNLKGALGKLASDTDAVIKARKFKISKSKKALGEISAAIKTYAVDVDSVIQMPGPHPSSHKLFK